MSGAGRTLPQSARAAAIAVVVAASSLAVVGLGGCSDDPGEGLTGPAAQGAQLAASYDCASCHSVDGSSGTGPTWKGIWGEPVELADGDSVQVDRAYVRRSITEPSAQVVDGFSPIMPVFDLPESEIEALTAYIRALGDDR